MSERSPSLFKRATRYHPGPKKTPRENSLTEALAAVLDHVEGLAAHLAER